MTPEQEKFWKILSEPYEQSCENCKYNTNEYCRSINHMHQKKFQATNCSANQLESWEWDGK